MSLMLGVLTGLSSVLIIVLGLLYRRYNAILNDHNTLLLQYRGFIGSVAEHIETSVGSFKELQKVQKGYEESLETQLKEVIDEKNGLIKMALERDSAEGEIISSGAEYEAKFHELSKRYGEMVSQRDYLFNELETSRKGK